VQLQQEQLQLVQQELQQLVQQELQQQELGLQQELLLFCHKRSELGRAERRAEWNESFLYPLTIDYKFKPVTAARTELPSVKNSTSSEKKNHPFYYLEWAFSKNLQITHNLACRLINFDH
jgi:hypothetical protein